MAVSACGADRGDRGFKLGRAGRAAIGADIELRQFAVEQARHAAADRMGVVEDDAAMLRPQPRDLGGERGVIGGVKGAATLFDLAFARRSEEHTSELQSLMRTSYAVFCLKK